MALARLLIQPLTTRSSISFCHPRAMMEASWLPWYIGKFQVLISEPILLYSISRGMEIRLAACHFSESSRRTIRYRLSSHVAECFFPLDTRNSAHTHLRYQAGNIFLSIDTSFQIDDLCKLGYFDKFSERFIHPVINQWLQAFYN